ncbi:MAG: hypothetical protein ACO3JL_17690 [Myxococcota bacterium]
MYSPSLKPRSAASPRVLSWLCFAALGWTLVLRGLLVPTLSLHWDEFNFLNLIVRVAHDESVPVLQTFHAHLFGWLDEVPGLEPDQIILGRAVMYSLSVVGTVCLLWLGRVLFGGNAGVFAAFLLGTFWFQQHHGASFRYDGLLVPASLGAACLVLSPRRPFLTAGLAGALLGVALLISLKAVFYLPSLLGLLWVPSLERVPTRQWTTRLWVFVAALCCTAVILYLAHRLSLPPQAADVVSTGAKIADKMFRVEPLPRADALLQTLRWDGYSWLLVLLGLLLVVADLVHGAPAARARSIRVLLLAAPLVSIYFYRNAWPYFYVSILPGACLLAGVLWARVERELSRRPVRAAVLTALLILPPTLKATVAYWHNREDETEVFRDISLGVREVFPEPAPYIDRCGMVADYPKVGMFMSTWVVESYRKAGREVMKDVLRQHQPKFLLENTEVLALHRTRRRSKHRLLPHDLATLRENFVPHWGYLWVAGKSLRVDREAKTFEVLISGPYTLEGQVTVLLDDVQLRPGDVIHLQQGMHRVRLLDEPKQVAPMVLAENLPITLRYGDHLPVPQRAPKKTKALFRGFSATFPGSVAQAFRTLPPARWNLDVPTPSPAGIVSSPGSPPPAPSSPASRGTR